jgi:hypothetical protein
VQYARERVGGGPTEKRFAVEATLTVGLTERLEVAVDAEPLVRLRGAEDETGTGDVLLGLKYRFFDPPEDSALPILSVQPFVKLLVASRPIGSSEVDFGAIALAGFQLTGSLVLDLNAGTIARGQRDGWVVQALLATGVTYAVARRVALFTDVAYATRGERGGRDALVLDAGLIWAPWRDLALDASVVTSLAGAGPDWAVRSGVSVRFGR